MPMFALHENRTHLLHHAVKIVHSADACELLRLRLEDEIIDCLILQFYPPSAMDQDGIFQRQPRIAFAQSLDEVFPNHESKAEDKHRLACISVLECANGG